MSITSSGTLKVFYLPGLSLPTDDKNIHKSKSDSPFVCLLVPFKLRSYLRCERENLKEIWYEIIVTVMQQLAQAWSVRNIKQLMIHPSKDRSVK